MVQPDLCVICDENKLDIQGCPDCIIEILSKGNTKREMRIKRRKEIHWLIYPYEQAAYQFVLNDEHEKYQLFKIYCGDDIATPFLFSDLEIDLKEVFLE